MRVMLARLANERWQRERAMKIARMFLVGIMFIIISALLFWLGVGPAFVSGVMMFTALVGSIVLAIALALTMVS